MFGKSVKMSMPEPDVEVTMFGKSLKMSMPKAEKMSMPEPIVLGDAKAEKMSLPKCRSTKKLSFDAYFWIHLCIFHALSYKSCYLLHSCISQGNQDN